jgi:phage terminase large subunit-like protein
LANVSPLTLASLRAKIEREQTRRRNTNRLAAYSPWLKQRQFHAAGRTESQRLFLAGNQLGKTWSGGAEWAMHLTGRYPDWWEGATFAKPVKLWAAGVSGEATRKNVQTVLVGPPENESEWGTGMVPKDALLDWDRATGGVPNLLDNIIVRWGGGADVQAGHSVLHFMAYEKGREKWQGPTEDGVWFDEEPPKDIYVEGLTRTNNGQRGQFVIVTCTPKKGMSDVICLFLTPEQVQAMIEQKGKVA